MKFSQLAAFIRSSLPLALLAVLALVGASSVSATPEPQSAKTRLVIIGLDHDHVWGLLNDLTKEPLAELVGVSETDPELISRFKSRGPANVTIYSDYVKMLDTVKPDAAIVTTANNKHLEILRECAKRHIHYSVEKPLATNGADAREMLKLAESANIKLMVNYWNAWVPPTPEIAKQVKAGQVGPVQRITVRYGHQGPKEIGVTKQFADWLYDPVKNGGGAVMDFGCYGAEWVLWLKGRPARVYATARKLKLAQNNKVDDDATIFLEFPDATAVIEASWDWPYGMGEVQVFGQKGSLIARSDELLSRTSDQKVGKGEAEGSQVPLEPLPHERSNPISYFVDRIRNNKPIEDPLAPKLNVGVVEILDAARESIRTGRVVEFH